MVNKAALLNAAQGNISAIPTVTTTTKQPRKAAGQPTALPNTTVSKVDITFERVKDNENTGHYVRRIETKSKLSKDGTTWKVLSQEGGLLDENTVRTQPVYRRVGDSFVKCGWVCEGRDVAYHSWYTISVGVTMDEMTSKAKAVLGQANYQFKCKNHRDEEDEVKKVLIREIVIRDDISWLEALKTLERTEDQRRQRGIPTLLDCLRTMRREQAEMLKNKVDIKVSDEPVDCEISDDELEALIANTQV